MGSFWNLQRLATMLEGISESPAPLGKSKKTLSQLRAGTAPHRALIQKLLISSNEVRLELVGKLLGGESKKTLSQFRAGAAGQNIELETAKFLDGIRVARLTILEGISESPAPLNQCPV
ncbi:hypothetical protein AYI68_g4781, partial [Smittium mucronatum]